MRGPVAVNRNRGKKGENLREDEVISLACCLIFDFGFNQRVVFERGKRD